MQRENLMHSSDVKNSEMVEEGEDQDIEDKDNKTIWFLDGYEDDEREL